jgi:hypothetical protein
MIKVNVEKLVEVGVAGQITQPSIGAPPGYRIGHDGKPFTAVGTGGICYNVRVGDPAFGWAAADQVEPGAAIRDCCCPEANTALVGLSCIGNEAAVISAALDGKDVKLKGALGTVVGKQGGAGHLIVSFPKRILDRLSIGDTIQVRACGVGLELQDFPDIRITNCGPRLFKALNPSVKGPKLRVQVSKVIPGKLVGAGMGSSNPQLGDFDIQSVSAEAVKEYDLAALRIGDIVAITDQDASWGPRFQPAAITVGVIVHGASAVSGHGPGVNALFSSAGGRVEPIITRKANLADLLPLS